MHGLGDNLHQRAVVRQLMERHVVYLETSWPCVYHDLVGPRLHLVAKNSGLRTQHKNMLRERSKFVRAPKCDGELRVWYTPQGVREAGSLLGAMMRETGTDIERADFGLPIPPAWASLASSWLEMWSSTKPLCIYRPLVERTEWRGCSARNPDFDAYADLFDWIRDRFFVVSVADLVDGVEWMVGHPVAADATFHAGELSFEMLAGLVGRAALVFSASGFAPILAQAVGAPSIVVYGGHECSRSFSKAWRRAPHLGIDPISPCDCFRHNHACDKRIDVPAAQRRIDEFLNQLPAVWGHRGFAIGSVI